MIQESVPSNITPQQTAVPARPNEQSRLNIDEFIKISDPNTRQVFVEQRA